MQSSRSFSAQEKNTKNETEKREANSGEQKMRSTLSRVNVADDTAPPARSRMNFFAEERSFYRSSATKKRERLNQAYRELSQTPANRQVSNPHKAKASQGGECMCASCGKSIWLLMRSADCPLCHEQNHKACLVGKVGVKNEKMQIEVDVCARCVKEVSKIRELDRFRNSFSEQRKIDIFYSAFSKLKVSISDMLSSFSELVIAIVQNSNTAKRDEFLACRKYHDSLRCIFTTMQKSLAQMKNTTFASDTEKKIAVLMGIAISEWMANHLEKVRALESHLKTITIVKETIIAPVSKDVAKEEKKPLKIKSIDPLICPMEALSYISITGENFDESAEVSIGGKNCSVYFSNPGLLVVLAPALTSEGPKSVVVTVKDQTDEISNVIIYCKQEFYNTVCADNQDDEVDCTVEDMDNTEANYKNNF